MNKMLNVISDEIAKISDRGLNTSNLETAYKLIDMYKDIKHVEYMDTKGEYYMTVQGEMEGSHRGYSRGYSRDSMGDSNRSYRDDMSTRRHYVRGHYSRNGDMDSRDHYMNSKESYRMDHSEACKQRVIDTLEDYMEDISKQMEDMLRDSDCREERDTIEKYIKKIRSII